jgi:glycosyl hydrolase family 28
MKGAFLRFFETLAILLLFAGYLEAQDTMTSDPLPATEPLSTRFHVSVAQVDVPVYLARICALTADQRTNLGTIVKSQTSETAFASFDLAGSTAVSVSCSEPVQSAKILPASRGMVPVISGNQITFTVTQPGALTLEVNGDWVSSLHLFANPTETDIPRPDDPNVLYYGPGIHEVESVRVTSGKTVYLAPGAVVYGTDKSGAPGTPVFMLEGSNIVLRGRGIIDASRCPYHTRSILGVHGTDIRVEGVILRDSSTWNMPVRQSDNVKIQNLKILGWRGNSDGIDICNSRQVEISGCFLRTLDDLIVLKTDKGQGELRNVTVKNCVLWNEFAHALSLGAELREPLTNVSFSDCDIIHDKGREWLLRVYNCDSAWVRNVTFENIRIEEARRLSSLWIGSALWSKETERGHIENISFRNIVSPLPERPDPWVDLVGFDVEHAIDNVEFRNIIVGGGVMTPGAVRQNEFVRNVVIQP